MLQVAALTGLWCHIVWIYYISYWLSLMKQYTENMEQKQQGNKQSLIYSGIKNIVKTSSGK